MDLTELRARRREILEVAERNGAVKVSVFGSASRGDSNSKSDIDFLVEFEDDRSLLDHSRLVLDLEELLGQKVHVLTPGSLHHSMRDRVLEEAQPL